MSQIALAFTANLTPSKGGGFGLFSTVDKLENRNLRAYLLTPKGEIPFVIPQAVPAKEELRKPIYRAASLPAQFHLRVITDDLVTKPYGIPFDGIRVEVWRMDFDSATLKASRKKLAERTVDSHGRVQP